MVNHERVKDVLASLAEDATTKTDGTDPVSEIDAADRRQTEPTSTTSSSRTADSTCAYREIITRAQAAVDDIDLAAAFVDEIGINELETAVQQAEHEVSSLTEDGQDALAAFREFRAAATGDNHFHHGHDTSLGDPGIPPNR
jgi:hypothetical protein